MKIIQRTWSRNLVCLPDRLSALKLSGRTFVFKHLTCFDICTCRCSQICCTFYNQGHTFPLLPHFPSNHFTFSTNDIWDRFCLHSSCNLVLLREFSTPYKTTPFCWASLSPPIFMAFWSNSERPLPPRAHAPVFRETCMQIFQKNHNQSVHF